jgi:hypothetical protein
MIHSVRVGNFRPSTHGFPFANSYPAGMPVYLFSTPFGAVGAGDASRGLCGGMVYAAMDLFHQGTQPIPSAPVQPVFRYICHRLFTSWGLPFAWVTYWDWQRRSGGDKLCFGVLLQRGVTRLTIEVGWPKIRQTLDAGQLCPLGLVKVKGWNILKLALNHQVCAYGYDYDETSGAVTLHLYDPNYPSDDTCTVAFHTRDPGAEQLMVHSCEGATVRGVFPTEYQPPAVVPDFGAATASASA